MAVGLYARELAVRVFKGKTAGLKHFGRDEIGCAHDIGGIFARHDKSVDVDDGGFACLRVDKDILVREVRVGQSGGVETSHRTCYLDAHVEMCQPRALLVGLEELVSQLGRGKPLAFLFLAVEHAPLEEEMLLVGGGHDTEPAVPFDEFRGPAEEIFPIFSPFLLEDALAVFVDDIVEPVARVGILLVAEESDDIALVGAEIYIFHRARAYHLVDKLDRRPVKGGQLYCLCHNVSFQ